ncbi:MAG TPA: 30S ribosomal protein S3 [Candidatus Saccharimonadales bacterium]|nr:30S ribosomal protein S3 [Candidatus Saccharimonadales bacterium]
MGQKVNPIGFRVGRFGTWRSRWFDEKVNYKNFLLEDIKIRKMLMDKLKLAGIDSVEIERLPKSMVVTLSVARPGVVIGRGGSGIEDVKKQIVSVIREIRGSGKTIPTKIDLHVNEVKNADLSAYLVAGRIVSDLERRMPSRRVATKTMEKVMQAGAKGVKIRLSGRVNGADIARVEGYHMGSVPTQTLRKEIDYAQTPALLKRGYVGVKVWIYKGE